MGVRILLGLLLWSSTRVALTSPAEQGILRAFRLPAARSSLVYNGFEPPCAELASAARFRPRHNLEGRLIVLHVATLKPNKGHGVMLDALVRLLPDCPSLHYVAVGQAGGLWQSHWESLQQSVARLGVPDRVHFLGHLSDPDLADAYAAADVVVVPSLAETFPLSVLDAMAWGKPLVASQVGGVGHMLSHERTGLLVPAGDGAALAVALGRLLREPALRASLGEAARAAVHARFAWPQVIERYEQLGRQLAGGG